MDALSPIELRDLSLPALATAVADGRVAKQDVDLELARRERELSADAPTARPRPLDVRQLQSGEREDEEP
jgi:hypothetical protein